MSRDWSRCLHNPNHMHMYMVHEVRPHLVTARLARGLTISHIPHFEISLSLSQVYVYAISSLSAPKSSHQGII